MILRLILICVFWCAVLDIADFYNEVMQTTYNIIYRNDPRGVPQPKQIKPFSCSLCMGWWTCLAYLIVAHHVDILHITLSVVFACVVPKLTLNLWNVIEVAIIKITNRFTK